MRIKKFLQGGACLSILAFSASLAVGAGSEAPVVHFPLPLDSYGDAGGGGLVEVLWGRVVREPFNLAATVIFVLAILHTFVAPKIGHLAHVVEERHRAKLGAGAGTDTREVSFAGQILHFFGEIEAVFGIWALVLLGALGWAKGWEAVVGYAGHKVNFTEPMFVVVIMALASTRPVILAAETVLRRVASLGGASVGAWWLTLLTLAPLFGSFITEPAAMTIAALLLGRFFYVRGPSPKLAYATLGLLFVNISVGGTLTHFAAPPVLMVAAPWGWDTAYMAVHFGWKAALAIAVSNLLVYLVFRGEFASLEKARRDAASNSTGAQSTPDRPVPLWVTLVQLGFIAWTVFTAHHPVFFIGGFLFFLAFAQATAHHQRPVDLRAPLLVGFFLAGLVVHGGLQGWWIEPVLKSLGAVQLYVGALTLTAFNDNAAITYLATLVPGFTESLKYAVVAGAVAGGGLTVIANAPNPAGQSLLQKYFRNGISVGGLFLGALFPTLVVSACFLLL